VSIPDYISPLVGCRVWQWDTAGLKSLNGEPWSPGKPLAAGCRAAARGTIVGRAEAVHGAHEPPHPDCTCGVYAAKNIEHLRQSGYERYGIHGQVYLWGTVVEHERGWRAQFGYPKSLFLPPDAIPFTLTEIDARLKTLIAFGTDIFIADATEKVRLWGKVSGFDAAGLDYLLKTRKQYYVRRQLARTLKKGDRVAILGRGVAVVERVDDKEALVVLWKRLVLRIARKDIVLNQQNMRWECEALPEEQSCASLCMRESPLSTVKIPKCS
jgi:preprotein translocase subunit YajC